MDKTKLIDAARTKWLIAVSHGLSNDECWEAALSVIAPAYEAKIARLPLIIDGVL